MFGAHKEYPDNSGIYAREAEGRRERAGLSFAEKLAALDELSARVAPIVQALEARRRASMAMSELPRTPARDL